MSMHCSSLKLLEPMAGHLLYPCTILRFDWRRLLPGPVRTAQRHGCTFRSSMLEHKQQTRRVSDSDLARSVIRSAVMAYHC